MENTSYKITLNVKKPEVPKVTRRDLIIEAHARGNFTVALVDVAYVVGEEGYSRKVSTEVGYGHWTMSSLCQTRGSMLLPTLEYLDTHMRYHALHALYQMTLPPTHAYDVIWSLIPKMCEEREEILRIFEKADIVWMREIVKEIRQGFEEERKAFEKKKADRKANRAEAKEKVRAEREKK